MICCSHQGDHGCVPQAASATPDRVGLVEQRAAALEQRPRGLGERLAAAGLDLDLRRDQLARRVLAERRRVGARLELVEAVDEVVRLRVDDLELLLDREGQILRAREVLACLVERREGVRDALAHRRERTSAFASPGAARNVPIPRVERSRRTYFLLLALACGLGWSVGLWAVPLLAFVVLETAWTIAEWAYERGSDRARAERAT